MSVTFLLPAGRSRDRDRFSHGSDVPYDYVSQGPPITYKTAQTTPPMASRSSLRKLFKNNKCCWRCGFQKKAHVRSGTAFGDKCSRNCGYEQCSKCNQRVIDFHPIGFVGPHCCNDPVPITQERVSDWYKPASPTGNI